MRRLFGSVLWAAAAVATAAACSFSAGSSVSVDEKDLAKEISAQLDEAGRARAGIRRVPRRPQGRSRCHDALHTQRRRRDLRRGCNVTKVDGTDVKFDLKVDDKPQ